MFLFAMTVTITSHCEEAIFADAAIPVFTKDKD